MTEEVTAATRSEAVVDALGVLYHEAVREALETTVLAEKCGFGHTALIQFGREYCSVCKPACLADPKACPLADLCEQVGVDPVEGTVSDPADTV